MKSIFARTALKIAVLSTLSSLSFAAQGPGSGNGDGDRAFALQKVAKANPGLTPQQVLLKAFEESAGRVPTFTYGHPQKYDTRFYAEGFLTEISKGENGGPGVELYWGQKEVTPNTVRDRLKFYKSTPDLGPMFPNSESKYTFSDARRNSFHGTYASFNGSLVLSVQLQNGATVPWIEMRALDSKTIVFVTRRIPSDGGFICLSLHDSKETKALDRKSSDDDICTIGYYWKE